MYLVGSVTEHLLVFLKMPQI